MMISWWEKTVEYAFVAEAVRDKLFVGPLAGRAERAGDAIAGSQGKSLLIEFKRDERALSSERGKFKYYERARMSLVDRDDHHFLIFGERGSAPGTLVLRYRTYFSRVEITRDAMLKRAKEKPAFDEYLRNLVMEKRAAEEDDGAPERYDLVAIIETSGGDRPAIVSVSSLPDYAREIRLELARPGPSRGLSR